MVPWWKRLVYSLVSLMVAALICDAAVTLIDFYVYPRQHSETGGFLPGLGIVFLFSLSGWLLAIPIVLIMKNIHGWRFGAYLTIGCVIGPLSAHY
jgi:hypothetical protein